MRIDQLQPEPTRRSTLEIPAELHDSVARHQANLAKLMVSLRAAGLPENMIDSSVRLLVDQYADELTAAIRAMGEAPVHA
jgi:hypothetical protein